ncbi:MAG TPA: Hsp70 family protein, partial [Candidatus Diapherotrites archaeon]|nr:Hsp70 family protein [Candidatus Diapherotrites archaeon]
TFDIDANGIVHVSAKDLGTGNEQKVTITASTNLSDSDIEAAVKEAEKFAAEDKKRKEEVEVRNNADSLVYQTEKNLKDLGDKLGSEDKARIEAELNNVKEALKGTDTEAIKAATEELTKVFYDISGKIYQANAGAQGPAGEAPQDDNTVNADYKVEDDK